ncbi:MAG: hypothetical protein WAM85_07485 [Terracidiphilus sp.]
MTGSIEEQDLKDRLSLIENMIAEGRRTTESWGWSFVFWGAAYYVAIGWSAWDNSGVAWPVTMIAATVLFVVLVVRKKRRHAVTTLGRSMSAIWIALGISMFLLFMSLGISGRLEDPRVFISVAAAMLGLANAASSIILKWKLQFACAVVWWSASVASCFSSTNGSTAEFLTAIFFCQIVFGLYGALSEGRKRRPRNSEEGAAHA